MDEEGDWAMARGIDKVSGWWKFVGGSREASLLMEMGKPGDDAGNLVVEEFGRLCG